MAINGLTLWQWAWHFTWLAGYVSLLWVPLVFAGYSLGRRQVGVRFLLVFAAVEALAVALAIAMYRSLQTDGFV